MGRPGRGVARRMEEREERLRNIFQERELEGVEITQSKNWQERVIISNGGLIVQEGNGQNAARHPVELLRRPKRNPETGQTVEVLGMDDAIAAGIADIRSHLVHTLEDL